MKTYKEYYELSKDQCSKSLMKDEQRYGKNWWKLNDEYTQNKFKTTQNYDFIKPLIDKNDTPLIMNTTNVYNSEWVILHHMFVQMVIDYIKDNNIDDNLYSYCININLDKPRKKWSIFLKRAEKESIILPESEPYDFPSYEFICDEDIISKFNSLNKHIYNCVKKFIEKHKDDIPIFLNNINFSIDELKSSLEYGAWVPSSDSSLSAGWDRTGDDNADELLVVSM